MGDALGAISLGIQVSQGLVQYLNSFHAYDKDVKALVTSAERLKIALKTTRDFIENPASQDEPEANKNREQLIENIRASEKSIKNLEAQYRKFQPGDSGFRNFGKRAGWHFNKQSLPQMEGIISDIFRNLEAGVNLHQLGQIGGIKNLMSEMNDALKAMPRDLNETWQRCFNNISKEDIREVTRLLTWLCFSQRPVTADELIDALAMPSEWSDVFDLADNRLKDPHDLLSMGCGLVESDTDPAMEEKLTKGSNVRLAHASVKEWIQSENVLENPQGDFQISEAIGHGMLAQTCILYLSQVNEAAVWTKDDFSSRPLAQYAALFWRFHLSKSDYGNELVDWACRLLLNDELRHKWLRIVAISEGQRLNSEDDVPEQYRRTPLAYAAEKGLDPVTARLLANPQVDVNESAGSKSALELAVGFDYCSTVKLLVDGGADVNCQVSYGEVQSILSLACWYSSPAMVKYLLDKGAHETDSGYSPLSCASCREDDEVFRLMLSREPEINRRSSLNEGIALHFAAFYVRLSNIQALIEHGADVRATDRYGELPLHCAVRREDCTPQLACLLIYEGAELVRGLSGDIPLYAAINGNEAVCETLIEAAPKMQVSGPESIRATIKAAGRGFLKVVKFLRENCTEATDSALFEAAINGHLHVVEYLLQKGDSPDSRNTDGGTAFSWAVTRGHKDIWQLLASEGVDIHATDDEGRSACHWAAFTNNVEALEWLLNNDADGNKYDERGFAPVHVAVIKGHLEALKVLFEMKADFRALDKFGSNVCHFAAENGHLEVLHWLYDQNVDVNVLDVDGSTPFLDAVHFGHLECVTYLAERTPKHKTQGLSNGRTPLAIAVRYDQVHVAEWMIANGFDVNEQYDLEDELWCKEWFALLDAIEMEHYEMTKLLLQKGANPNLHTAYGSTPLLLAAQDLSISYLHLLIEYGACMEDVQDVDGDDVLLCAVENEDIAVLRWLIDRGSKVDIENQYGFTPLLKAAMRNQKEIVETLDEAGAVCCAPDQPSDGEAYPDDMRQTSLWYAGQALRSFRARLNIRGRYTPLMVSAHGGYLEVVKYFSAEFSDFKKCLDKDGNDALTYACCGGNAQVAEFLIDNGFDKERMNWAGRTVVEETEEFLKCLRDDVEYGEGSDARNDDVVDEDEKSNTGNAEDSGNNEDEGAKRANPEEVAEYNEELQKRIGEVLQMLRSRQHQDVGTGDKGEDNDNDKEIEGKKSGNDKSGPEQENSTEEDNEHGGAEAVGYDGNGNSDDSEADDVFFPAKSRQGTEFFGDQTIDTDLDADPSKDSGQGHGQDLGVESGQRDLVTATVTKAMENTRLGRRVNTL